jgi:PPM family protein phosphatase
MTRFAAGAATDVGQLRTINQDNTLVADDVFAVADGMGGHRGGEVASAVAVDALRQHFRDRTPMSLVDAVREANHAVVTRAQGDPDLRGMGTTLCALARVEREDGDEVLTIVNVGDSRAYLLKKGEAALVQISEDHSLVQQLVRQGQLEPDAAATHPQRNILTRALGIDRDVKPDAFVLLPVRGDRYVLCSDGLFNEVTEERIAQVLRQTADPRQAAQLLVHLANEGGGRDNISVVIVDILDAGGHRRALEKQSDDHRLVDVVRFEDRPLDLEPVDQTVIDRGLVVSDGPAGRDPATQPVPRVPASGARPGIGERTGPAVVVNRTPGGQRPPLVEPVRRDPDAGLVVERPLVSPGVPAMPPRLSAEPVVLADGRTRFTWRVVLFLLAFIGVFVGGFYAVNWVADNSYYVGLDQENVVIFQGKPGGVLWRQPRIEQVTDMRIDNVLLQFQPDVRKGREQPTLAEAVDYVMRVRATTTTTTTTTTTVPPPTVAPEVTVPTTLGTGP